MGNGCAFPMALSFGDPIVGDAVPVLFVMRHLRNGTRRWRAHGKGKCMANHQRVRVHQALTNSTCRK